MKTYPYTQVSPDTKVYSLDSPLVGCTMVPSFWNRVKMLFGFHGIRLEFDPPYHGTINAGRIVRIT